MVKKEVVRDASRSGDVRRRWGEAVGDGKVVEVNLKKGLRVFTLNLPKGYKVVIVVGDTYPLRWGFRGLGMEFSYDIVQSVGEPLRRLLRETSEVMGAGIVGKKFFDLFTEWFSEQFKKVNLRGKELGWLFVYDLSLYELLSMLRRLYKEIVKSFKKKEKEPLYDDEKLVLYYKVVIEPFIEALEVARKKGLISIQLRDRYMTGYNYTFRITPLPKYFLKYLDSDESVAVKVNDKGRERWFEVKREFSGLRDALRYITAHGWFKMFTPKDVRSGKYEEFMKELSELVKKGNRRNG